MTILDDIVIKDFPEQGMNLVIPLDHNDKIPTAPELVEIIKNIISQIPKIKSQN